MQGVAKISDLVKVVAEEGLVNYVEKCRSQCGIYLIVNLVNNKVYVGSTRSAKKRWFEHRCTLRNRVHPNPHLQSAWNQYGEESFIFGLVELCEKGDSLNLSDKENQWMVLLNSCDREKWL